MKFPAARTRLEPVQDRRQEQRRRHGGAEGLGGAARAVLFRRRGRVGVGVAARGRAVVLARAAVLAQTEILK